MTLAWQWLNVMLLLCQTKFMNCVNVFWQDCISCGELLYCQGKFFKCGFTKSWIWQDSGTMSESESCFCRQLCYSWTYSNYNNCSWVKLSSACQKHDVWTGLSIFFFSGGQDSIRDYVTVFYRLLCHSSATATFMRSRLLSTSFSASSALNWIPNPAAWLICSTFSPNNISGREGSSSSEEILWEKGIV